MITALAVGAALVACFLTAVAVLTRPRRDAWVEPVSRRARARLEDPQSPSTPERTQ